MSQTQQKVAFSQTSSVEALPVPIMPSDEPQVTPEATWEPYLDLVKSWQRADATCTRAIERANATRRVGEDRAFSAFEAEKSKLDSAHQERTKTLESQKKQAYEQVDALLKQVQKTEKGVRRALRSVNLENLMDGIQVPLVAEPSAEHNTVQLLQETVTRSLDINEALQDDLFALRAARQRQSAQMWAVGIGLWLVAAVAFAPYAPISALLVGIAVFVMATPRKVETSDGLRPSFASHIAHCLALLVGKQQVMQYPFSLVEKGSDTSGVAVGGALAAGLISWIVFETSAPLATYELTPLAWHLGFMAAASSLAGIISYAVANQDVTLAELSEGNNNKILR